MTLSNQIVAIIHGKNNHIDRSSVIRDANPALFGLVLLIVEADDGGEATGHDAEAH